jgi:hypothetical protein
LAERRFIHTLIAFALSFLVTIANNGFESSSVSEGSTIPRRETATVGSRVVLPCNTTSPIAVDWIYQPSLSDDVNYVNLNDEIYKEFKARFILDTTVKGVYNLTINNVQLEDAGFYKCIEERSFGRHHRPVLLLVLNGKNSESDATTKL